MASNILCLWLPEFQPELSDWPVLRASNDAQRIVDPGESFTLYPKLSLELRIMITKLAIKEGARTVMILHTGLDPRPYTGKKPRNKQNPKAYCKVTTPSPAVLHVNTEMRDIALKTYNLFTPVFFENPFYFHSALDTLFIPSVGLAHVIQKNNLPR